MAITYGLPYMGSKNSIAKNLIKQLPRAENFYDLFCGGGAMAHRRALSGKYKHIYCNDLTVAVEYVERARRGEYDNRRQWVDREEFIKNKNNDVFLTFAWSFGNNGQRYMYGQHIEPFKKRLHFAYIENDNSLLKEFYSANDIPTGHEAVYKYCLQHSAEIINSYIKWYQLKYIGEVVNIQKLKEDLRADDERLRNYLIEQRNKNKLKNIDVDKYLGTNGMRGHYFGRSQWEFPTRENYNKLNDIMNWPLSYDEVCGNIERRNLLKNLQRLKDLSSSLKNLQALNAMASGKSAARVFRLQHIDSLKRFKDIQNTGATEWHFSRGSYEDVKIKNNSVIYCDIPYRNTKEYSSGAFDYDKFYKWRQSQKNIYISEYNMPAAEFREVYNIEKTVLMSAKSNSIKAVDKLFIPRKNKLHFEEVEQLTLY